MTRSVAQLRQVYLRPGELYVGDVPSRVTTVLGSCISVTFFHRREAIGGICHAVMPMDREKTDGLENRSADARYVDSAIRHLLRKMMRSGVRLGELEVKLFGGAALMRSVRKEGEGASVGFQNVSAAQQILQTEGLKIAASDVGGTHGRKIIFFTHTGAVLLKRLNGREFPRACPPLAD